MKSLFWVLFFLASSYPMHEFAYGEQEGEMDLLKGPITTRERSKTDLQMWRTDLQRSETDHFRVSF
jgi:hypothetical protein